MSKFCQYCGNVLIESDKFCKRCGTPVVSPKASNVKWVMTAALMGLAAAVLIIIGILVIPDMIGSGEGVTGGYIGNQPGNVGMQSSGTQPGSNIAGFYSETISLPEQPYPVVVMEISTTLATQQYVTARLYLDALIEIDLNEETEAEFTALLDETIMQFALADEYAAQAVITAELVQYCINSGMTLSNMFYNPAQDIRFLATDPSLMNDKELKQWAREIEEMANKLPTQAGIAKTLGEQLGVDARMAAQMLRDAFEVIRGESAKDAAFWNRMMNYALATKTGCKVAVTIGAAIASGGATTILQGAALLATSADVIAEVAVTGTTIFLGEDHALTKLYSGIQDYTAPVSAVLGVITLDFSKVDKLSSMSVSAVRELLKGKSGEQILNGVSYFGGQLQDLFADDRFMGLNRDSAMDLADPGSQMVLGFVYGLRDLVTGSDGKIDPDKLKELNEALKDANLPPIPETITQDPPAPEPPLEKAQETAPQVSPKDVDDYINELLDWMIENGIITAEEAMKYRPGGEAADITGDITRNTTGIEGMYSGTIGNGLIFIVVTKINDAGGNYEIMFNGTPYICSADIDDSAGSATFTFSEPRMLGTVASGEITTEIFIVGERLTGSVTAIDSSGELDYYQPIEATKQYY